MLSNVTSEEDRFRASMKVLREELGMTQTDLSARMRERGFAFHQQTVQRIENGDRPVRLGEAHAIAELLLSSIEEMSIGRGYESLARSTRELSDMSQAIERLVDDYETERAYLAVLVDQVAADPESRVDLTSAEAWTSLSAVHVADAVQRRKAERSGKSDVPMPGVTVVGLPEGPAVDRYLASRKVSLTGSRAQRASDGEHQATG